MLKKFKKSIKGDISLDEIIIDQIKSHLAKYVLYQEECGMYLPKDFDTDPSQWLVVLNQIKFSFDQKSMNDNNLENLVTKDMTVEQLIENDAKIQEGFELFGKYLQDLKN